MDEEQAIVLGPGEGERVGPMLTFKATSESTHGRYSLIEETCPPGFGGPPIHTHRDESEAFYIVSGDLTMLLGEDTIVAAAGSFVFVPAGTAHGFANRTDAPVTFIFMYSPGGFEGYFREVIPALAAGEAPAILRDISVRYGSEVVAPPLGMGD
ncbi:MAG: cupin domain-containing protein [Chloroflexi bacterium]|nr:cupin domain-containing protein [Chloroflexota bacterium]